MNAGNKFKTGERQRKIMLVMLEKRDPTTLAGMNATSTPLIPMIAYFTASPASTKPHPKRKLGTRIVFVMPKKSAITATDRG